MTQELAENIIKGYNNYKGTLDHNERLLCILEGELLKFVEAHLSSEFSPQSFKNIQPRIAPINFLIRIVEKLSKIYDNSPQRIVVDGTDKDKDLLDWYVKQMRLNYVMHNGNRYFNTFKNNLNQIYLDDGQPRLRAVANDRFFLNSTNMVDRTIPTEVLLPFGQEMIKDHDGNDQVKNLFKLYSAENIFIVDDQGKPRQNPDNPENVNPFGSLNGLFMYVNRSPNFLLPPMDTDTMRMTVLLPVLLSDLNYAVKYQAFSILYGINVDDQNLAKSPEAFWMFKTDPGDDNKPEVGQIKPQVDITEVIQLIVTELSMWLNSRNIRPGSVSDVSAENMVSGISKLVDEMDTSDDRQKQAELYASAEEKWWSGVMHNVHPYWVSQREIDTNQLFSANARVEVTFPEQLPTMRRGQIVADLKTEVEAGFISRRSAMKKLNPEWTEQRLEEELLEIEKPITLEVEGEDVEDETTRMTEEGRTTSNEGHFHEFTIDQDGNGQTSTVDGHVHEIDGGVVMEADGHAHTLVK